jgi:hypothetical protein
LQVPERRRFVDSNTTFSLITQFTCRKFCPYLSPKKVKNPHGFVRDKVFLRGKEFFGFAPALPLKKVKHQKCLLLFDVNTGI